MFEIYHYFNFFKLAKGVRLYIIKYQCDMLINLSVSVLEAH